MPKFRIKARYIFIVLGLILIIGSLSMELLPTLSSGIGPLQIAGIFAGIVFLGFSFLRGSLWIKIFAVFFSLSVTIIIIELALAVLGFTPNHYPGMIDQLTLVDYFVCDKQVGCRFNPESLPEYC